MIYIVIWLLPTAWAIYCPVDMCNCSDKSLEENPFGILYQCNFKGTIVNVFHKIKPTMSLTIDNKVAVQRDFFQNFPWTNEVIANTLGLEEISEDVFDNLTTLNIIQLSDNELTVLPPTLFSSNPSIQVLTLDGNRLKYLPETLFPKPELVTRLFLGSNQIQNLSDDSFQNFTSLEWLFLDCNDINTLPKRMINNNIHLSRLVLNRNNFSEIPEDFFENNRQLQKLNLSHNQLIRLPDSFSVGLIALRELDLSFNKLQFLSENVFLNLNRLLYLDLSKNHLRNIEFESFRNIQRLTHLDLSYNKLDLKNPFHIPSMNLLSLNLSYNFIQRIPSSTWKNLTSLVDLDLRNNYIDFLNIEDLNFFYLSDKNKIQRHIHNRGRSRNIYFDAVYLQENRIAYIDLQYEKVLQRINSSESEPLHLEYPTSIYLDYNPIRCDCDSIPLHTQLTKNEDILPFKFIAENLRCNIPPVLHGLPITQVSQKDLQCENQSNHCPQECECFPNSEGTTVDCSGISLTEIPSFENSFNVFRLQMSFTHISNLSRFTNSSDWVNLKQLILKGSFQDDNRSILKMESKPFSKLQNLLYLDLSRNNFRYIPEDILEGLSELLHLDLSFNNLATVTSSLLKYSRKLEILNLRYNKITSIHTSAFSKLSNLQNLFLSNNLLQEVPKAITNETIHLKKLDLGFNKLKYINDSINLPSIQEINIQNNQLQGISIEWPNSLQYMFLQNNEIKQIQNLGILPQTLHLLNLTNNEIESLNISQFTEFKDNVEIILTNNQIKNIQVSDNNSSSNLTVQAVTTFQINSNPLHCDCNLKSFLDQRRKPITETSIEFDDDELFCKTPSFHKGFSVEELKVDKLVCESDTDCPSQCSCYRPFYKRSHDLDCTQNPGDSLPSRIPSNVTKGFFNNLTFSSLSALSESQWRNLTELEIWILSGNSEINFKIDIFQSLPSLNQLHIKRCTESYPVNSLAHLKNLEILQITNCKMQTLIKSDFFIGTTKLTKISLSGNRIEQISEKLLDEMNSLQELDLSYNSISSLDTDFFKQCINLRVLNLADNSLISLDPKIFIACKKLKDLNLSRNNFGFHDIRELELEDTSLEKLNFSHNSIEDISFNWIKILSLKEIDLSQNKIAAISLTTLSEVACGAQIYLQNNVIQSISNHNIKNHCYHKTSPEKTTVNFNNNPINCDCKIFDFLQISRNQDSSSILFNTSDLYCAKPPHLTNRLLVSIEEEDLICLQNDLCSQSCSCYSQVERNVTDCSGRKLKHLPRISSFMPTVLKLDDNNNVSIEGLGSLQWLNLKELSLKNSKCRECKNESKLFNIFQNSTELMVLELPGNEISTIRIGSFARLKKLRILDLSNNNIQQLSYNSFQENKEIETLDLSRNIISYISPTVFGILLKLKYLSLSQNKIRKLPESLLANQRQLQYLNLSFNELSSLPQYIFEQMSQLKLLDLSHNKIQIPKNNVFQIPPSVTNLNLSNNEMAFISEELWNSSPPSIIKLKNLDLSENNITDFSLQPLLSLLGNNSFCFINLNENSINHLNLTLSKDKTNSSQMWSSWLTFSLSNNPGICDCEIAEFRNHRHLKMEGNYMVSLNITIPKNSCTERPDANIPNFTSDLQPFCYNSYQCPRECKCLALLNSRETVMDCSSKGLHQLPKGEFTVNKLFADHNQISDITDISNKRWINLSYIDFSFNNIHSLSNITFGKTLEFISLKGNRLERPSGWLDYYVTQSVTPSFQLNLAENPWICDCDTLAFQKWLLKNENKVKDILKVTCSDGKVLLNTDVCFKRTITILVTALISLAILLIIFTALYFRHRNAVHVWLYSHNICFVKEELIDEDKEFDAFVSYTSEDRDFVFDHLVPALEEEKPYFQLCIHERDWKVGEGIIEQIGHSIEASRRIIFVVSESFVESSWSCFEFKTAHFRCVVDKINRIIIIVLGNLPPKEKLDPDLRLHINMNTYLQCGDPKFFDKLRYAMPKKKPEKRQIPEDEFFSNSTLELQQIITS